MSELHAILIALAGFTAWVLADTCAKFAGEMAIPPHETLGFIGWIGVTVLMLWGWRRGDVAALRPRRLSQQLLQSLIVTGNIFASVIAVKHLSLTVFYVIVFTAPILVAILEIIFLRERLPWPKAMAILIGFIGVACTLSPWEQSATGDWIGYCAVAAGVALFAIGQIYSRALMRTESVICTTFFSALMAAVVGSVLSLSQFEPLSLATGAAVFGAGLFFLLGNFLNYLALRHITATTVAQFHYSQIIVGAAFGYLIWNDAPSWNLALGGGLIIAAGLYILMQAAKTEKPTPVVG